MKKQEVEDIGVFGVFNYGMHCAWGSKEKGLVLNERGEGLRATVEAVEWFVDNIEDARKEVELAQMWVDALIEAARKAGCNATSMPVVQERDAMCFTWNSDCGTPTAYEVRAIIMHTFSFSG